jgi:hypothetical protein
MGSAFSSGNLAKNNDGNIVTEHNAGHLFNRIMEEDPTIVDRAIGACTDMPQQPPSLAELDEGQSRCVEENIAKFLGPQKLKALLKKEVGRPDPVSGQKAEIITGIEGIGTLNTKQRKDVQALGKYLEAQLKAALYGDQTKDKTHREIEHAVYYDLMETQLGKALIAQLTNYCMQADENTFKIPRVEDEKKSNRKNNLEKLGSFTLPGRTDGMDHFSQCIPAIKYIAEKKDKCAAEVKYDALGKCEIPTGQTKFSDKEYDVSRPDALIVMRNVEHLRNNLVKTGEIKEAFAKTEQGSHTFSRETDFNVSVYDPNKKGQTIDDLTTLNSGEYVQAVYESGARKEMIDEINRDCASIGGIAPDPARCGYVASEKDREYLKQQEEEELARTVAVSEEIKTFKAKDFEPLLKSEGRSEAEIELVIKEMEADPAKLKLLQEKYANKLRDTRMAIFKKNHEKVAFQKDPTKQNADGIIAEIKQDMAQVTGLLHYTNVISGYLSIKGKKDKDLFNVKSLEAELGNSFHAFAANPEVSEDLIEQFGLNEADLNIQKLAAYDDHRPKGKEDKDGRTTLDAPTVNANIVDLAEEGIFTNDDEDEVDRAVGSAD